MLEGAIYAILEFKDMKKKAKQEYLRRVTHTPGGEVAV